MTFCEFPVPTFEEWQQEALKSLDGNSIETLLTKKAGGLVIQPLYQKRFQQLNEQIPGVYPFLRGTDSRRNQWLISQKLSANSANKINKLAKKSFGKGQDVYHIDPLKKNVINHIRDVRELFRDIPLTAKPIHFNTREKFLPILAAMMSVAKERGESISALKGIVAQDPLQQLVEIGVVDRSFPMLYDEMAKGVKWALEQIPQVKTVLVHSHIYHNGGASPVDEIAFSLATGVEYVAELIKRGVTATDAGRSIVFSIPVGTDFFAEIAKFRSVRVLWAAIMKEFGATEEGQKIFIHAEASSFTQMMSDPYLNILRGTTEAFAALLGGSNSIHIEPFDKKVKKKTNFSQRIARNTLLILREEAQFGHVVDPIGGAWFVERLTEDMARAAWRRFQSIEKEGGMSTALKKGIPQAWVDEEWKKKQADIEHLRQIIIGTNRYVTETEREAHRQTNAQVEEPTLNVEFHESIETFNEVEEAVEKGIYFSKLTKLLRHSSCQTTITPIASRSWGQSFDRLIEKSRTYEKKNGKKPHASLLLLDEKAEIQSRYEFVHDLLSAGGFEVVINHKHSATFMQMSSHVLIILCGKNESYKSFIKEMKEASPLTKGRKIYVTGATGSLVNQLKVVGIQESITKYSNAVQLLSEMLEWIEEGSDERT
ncbi:methylmalonyl-CoA mutase family protein [Halalkalibacter urbisdiaboli]|uniref:methylmalonyl-CoA mutase family protein n=1 Tax=Halalkalibacter urbisdiaboli TaxID=1960589 RepID=UPI0013FD8087|nr:methylmalonyl-CoA mutase family protein [Halalkalibacter urbisdiaboli]